MNVTARCRAQLSSPDLARRLAACPRVTILLVPGTVGPSGPAAPGARRNAPRSFRLHVRGPSTSVEGATDTVVPGSTARYGGSSTTRREGLRFLGAWFSFGRSDVLLSRAAADGESRRTGSTGSGGSRFVGYRRSPGRHRCGTASVDETRCSSERQRGTDRRARHSFGRGPAEQRNTVSRLSCVHRDR